MAPGLALTYVGTRRDVEQRIMAEHGVRFVPMRIEGLKGRGLKSLRGLVLLPLAFAHSLLILVRTRPGLVIGVGGYSSGPIVLLAVVAPHPDRHPRTERPAGLHQPPARPVRAPGRRRLRLDPPGLQGQGRRSSATPSARSSTRCRRRSAAARSTSSSSAAARARAFLNDRIIAALPLLAAAKGPAPDRPSDRPGRPRARPRGLRGRTASTGPRSPPTSPAWPPTSAGPTSSSAGPGRRPWPSSSPPARPRSSSPSPAPPTTTRPPTPASSRPPAGPSSSPRPRPRPRPWPPASSAILDRPGRARRDGAERRPPPGRRPGRPDRRALPLPDEAPAQGDRLVTKKGYRKLNHIHMVGIGGTGMNGIAEVLLNLGYKVSGSDIQENDATRRLVRLGAEVADRPSGREPQGRRRRRHLLGRPRGQRRGPEGPGRPHPGHPPGRDAGRADADEVRRRRGRLARQDDDDLA